MTEHEAFLTQYVLNRCIGNTGSMDGESATNQAEKAWGRIQELAGSDSYDIGAQTYRGNTISYIYDKCRNYGEQFDCLNAEVQRLSDELHAVLAERDMAARELDRANKELTSLVCSIKKPTANPALENVLAKLRVIANHHGIHREGESYLICCVAEGDTYTRLTVGDLRRWVESEGKS
jgi:hypothetical protein